MTVSAVGASRTVIDAGSLNDEGPLAAYTPAGGALYSGKEAGAAAAAPAAARPTREEAISRLVDELSLGGRMDVLTQDWLDPKHGVRFELAPGSASYYDARKRVMLLGADSTPAEHAQAVVFARRTEQYEAEDAQRRADLGHDAYDRSARKGRHDPSLHAKYEAGTREEFVARRVDVLARAAGDAVEFTRRARANGATAPVTALEKIYTAAHQPAHAQHMQRQFDELANRTGRYADGRFNADLATAYADEYARPAARGGLAQAFADGRLLSASGEKYTTVFGRQWDAHQAEQARQAAETEKGAAASRARSAEFAASYKQLAELVAKVDANGPEAAHAIEVIDAFLLKYPEQRPLFVAQNDAQLVRLLGRYGYVSDERVGKLAGARLDYAMSNFHRLTPEERAVLSAAPGASARFGISHRITYEEMQAGDANVVTRHLPDGTKHTGSGAQYREASRNNANHHALAHLAQIRSAGPFSLIGRLFGGEQGAAVGAMFDSVTPAATAASGRARHATTSAPVDMGSRRAEIVDRRPPPTQAPTGGPTPAVQPERAGINKGPVAYEPPQPRIRAVTQSGMGAPHAATQPAAAGPAAGVPTGTGGGNTGIDAGRAANGARYWEKRAESQARAEVDAAHRQDAASNAAHYALNVRPTLPPPFESIRFERVVDGIQRQGWNWHVNNERATHESRWVAGGNSLPAPLAYRFGDHIYVDYRALTPAQERALDRALNAAALRR